MISFEELHRKTLPEKKKKFVKVDFVSYYLWRPLCDFISILLMPTKITPTGVTIFSFYTSLLSLIVFIILPGKIGALLGYLLIWIWNISDGIDGNILNNPWRVLDGGVPFLKKQSFNYNDNVLSLYQFLSNDWLSEVFAYTKTYGIWETNTGFDSVYKKVFRMSLFGIPIVTLRRNRNQWKAYLFDFIPVMKISL